MSDNKYILDELCELYSFKTRVLFVHKNEKILTNAKCILFDPILQQVKELEIQELEKKFNDKYEYKINLHTKKEIFLSSLASNAIPYIWYVFVVDCLYSLYIKVHNWLYKILLRIFLIPQFYGSIPEVSQEFYKFKSYGNKAYYYCV